ncbi:FAD:protein FMN transferase [Methanolobus chelungpuianus]|uniref:FAD:protein FMN transferase n=1 Tax=Methanolobus chelungpuianus TaxID=502115 RepID=A0AAE3H9A9_9EURY|nr:FAD:protein FMN transferase [Methanolobus chelungpuianus]MCQ6961977.1 membrane protein [Methanolobus chelungpuianus]
MKYKTVAIVIVVAFMALLIMNYIPSSGQGGPGSLETYSSTRSIMDTTVTITVLGHDEELAHESIDKAFGRIEYVDALMNNYDNSSDLSVLNRQGYITDANPDLAYVINRSAYYSESSQGAFDISIQPLLDLWKSKFIPGSTNAPPTEEEINETLKLVNHSAITIENRNISLEEGMKLTLGGVAKGYAVDLAVESLLEDGIESGFVNAGGDGRYIGTKAGGIPWKVGLQNPEKSEEAIAVMDIEDVAVATSGNYERYFNEAAKVSHISDPRTGYPSQSLMSSTVIAGSAMDADAFATALFVMGEEDGMEMIEKLEGVECLIITADKRIIRSSGFSQYENQ